MTISLQNKTVVITGGAKRVGRAIALECAASGADVAITFNHSENEARALIEQLRIEYSNAQFECFQCELSRDDEVRKLAQNVVQRFGRVDALVNNAAIFRRTPFETLTENDFDSHINSNLKAPFLTSKVFGDLFSGAKVGRDCQHRRYSRTETAEKLHSVLRFQSGTYFFDRRFGEGFGAARSRQLPLSRNDFAALGNARPKRRLQRRHGAVDGAHSAESHRFARRNRANRCLSHRRPAVYFGRRFAGRWRGTFALKKGRTTKHYFRVFHFPYSFSINL